MYFLPEIDNDIVRFWDMNSFHNLSTLHDLYFITGSPAAPASCIWRAFFLYLGSFINYQDRQQIYKTSLPGQEIIENSLKTLTKSTQETNRLFHLPEKQIIN
jgi:hypothetical protein